VARFRDPFQALLNLQRSLESTRRSDWFGGTTASRGAFPPINVFGRGHDFVVVAELPGVEKDALTIELHRRKLRVAGAKAVSYPTDVSAHRRERASGSFDRTITFPVDVDPDGAKAAFDDGILTLHVPRSEAEKPRSIAVG
jgi:HSP20 family protein